VLGYSASLYHLYLRGFSSEFPGQEESPETTGEKVAPVLPHYPVPLAPSGVSSVEVVQDS
jgi:hypothetical protein